MHELKNEFVTTQSSGFSLSEAGTIETWKAFHRVKGGREGESFIRTQGR
jgi:hypothetical protein